MISLVEGRKVVITDMILTGLMKMTFLMTNKDLEEVAEFFEAQARYELVVPSSDLDKAEAKAYAAVAEFARQVMVLQGEKTIA